MCDISTLKVKTAFKDYNVIVQKSIDLFLCEMSEKCVFNGISLSVKEDILPNVDFLSELIQLEYLNLGSVSYEDLTAIEKLANLECLRLEGNCAKSLNLTKLSKLQDLFVVYNKQLESIFECVNLKRLVIHHYKKKNLDEFATLKKLQRIEIWSSPIQNIDGLMDLKEIACLELRYLRKLESIEGIKNNASITELLIQNCKKITDWEVIGTLPNLKHLKIDSCGKIPTLKFLEKSEKLETIWLVSDTFIEDGELSWLMDKPSLKAFHVPIENHYDVTLDQKSLFNNFGIKN